jgi:hypothetical protein
MSARLSTVIEPSPLSAMPMLIAVTPAGIGGRFHDLFWNELVRASRGPSVQSAHPACRFRAHSTILGRAPDRRCDDP